MTIVQFHGTDIDFGDLSLPEIQQFLSAEQDKIDQGGIDKWLKPLMAAIPEPIDYSNDISALGTLLVQIKEQLSKEGHDYSPEFAKMVDAVQAIEIPKPETADMTGVIDAVNAIAIPEASPVDLKPVTALLAQLVAKNPKVVVEPEKRPVATGFEIVERDDMGNAKMIEVRY